MKTDIGKGIALYPMPITVFGAMVDGKPSWMEAAHVGIVAHAEYILVSCMSAHYTAKQIEKGTAVSVSLVDEKSLDKADYVGKYSGNKVDKSGVFKWHAADNGAPVPEELPLTMVCTVADIYPTEGFSNYMLKIESTLVDESLIGEGGVIDYTKFKPVLFEGPTYSYIATGDIIGPCTKIAKE